MQKLRPDQLLTGLSAAFGLCVLFLLGPAAAQSEPPTRGGVTAYLGLVPIQMVKGLPPHSAEQPMHGRVPRGAHEYQLVAAVFDVASGSRSPNATVAAQVPVWASLRS